MNNDRRVVRENELVLLIRKRRVHDTMLLSSALFFYFLLPLSLVFFPSMMVRSSFFLDLSWAWLYTFFQIPMTWFYCWEFHRMANVIDRKIQDLYKEEYC